MYVRACERICVRVCGRMRVCVCVPEGACVRVCMCVGYMCVRERLHVCARMSRVYALAGACTCVRA